MNKKRAFTLIELLVVIAIIAILAAILFPVFAQAKAAAKKSVCVSNLKQQTLAVIMYTGDYDDTYPVADVNFPGFGWLGSGFIGWQYPCDKNETNTDCVFEGNSIQPYEKNQQLALCPATTGSWNPYGYGSGNHPSSSYTINGDLSSYSATAATTPVVTVMFWSGVLNNGWVGRTTDSPALNCPDGNAPCKYVANPTGALTTNGTSDVPTVYNSGNYTFPNYSKWVHGHGDNMSNLDGHAKYHPLSGSVRDDPWAFTGPDGSVQKTINVFPIYTNAPGGHMCLMGPDNPCGL